MIVNSKQMIGPVPILEMRRFLRFHRYRGSFTAKHLQYYLNISAESARAACSALQHEGYTSEVEDMDGYNAISDKGIELARSTAATPVRRKSADKTLEQFMARVAELNSSDDYLMSVSKVVVFGSYLSDKDPIGDLDIAVDVEPRWDPGISHEALMDLRREHFRKSGRNHSWNVDGDIYEWPELQVKLRLRNRQRSISLQPWYSFISMDKHPSFEYRALLGDGAAIAEELAQSASKKA